jgi:hypothetical protein
MKVGHAQVSQRRIKPSNSHILLLRQTPIAMSRTSNPQILDNLSSSTLCSNSASCPSSSSSSSFHSFPLSSSFSFSFLPLLHLLPLLLPPPPASELPPYSISAIESSTHHIIRHSARRTLIRFLDHIVRRRDIRIRRFHHIRRILQSFRLRILRRTGLGDLGVMNAPHMAEHVVAALERHRVSAAARIGARVYTGSQVVAIRHVPVPTQQLC